MKNFFRLRSFLVSIANKQQVFCKELSWIFIFFYFCWNSHELSRSFRVLLHICILSFDLHFMTDSDHSIAKYSNSFNSNKNFSGHFICTDCHENEITCHWRRHRNLLQSYILILINRSETHFFKTWKKSMQRVLYSIRSTRTSKLIEIWNKDNAIDSEDEDDFINDDDKFLNIWQWWIMYRFLINNKHFSIFHLC